MLKKLLVGFFHELEVGNEVAIQLSLIMELLFD
jgi:hypothetical protein